MCMLGGDVDMRYNFDVDYFGYFDLVEVIESLGYSSFEKLAYSTPTCTPQWVCDDKGVAKMINFVLEGVKFFKIYVENGVKGNKESNKEENTVGNKETSGDFGQTAVDGIRDGGLENIDPTGDVGHTAADVHIENASKGMTGEEGLDVFDLVENYVDSSDEIKIKGRADSYIEDCSDSDDSLYSPTSGSSSEDGLGDDELASGDEEFIMARKNLKSFRKFKSLETKDGAAHEEGDMMKFDGADEYEIDSDCEVNSDSSSDEASVLTENRGKARRRKRYDPLCDHMKLEFCIGMRFLDGMECKNAVRSYGIAHGFPIQFNRTGLNVLEAHCRGESCDWKLYASLIKRDNTFAIKTIKGTHKCNRVLDNALVNADFITREFMEEFRVNPKYGVKEMQRSLLKKYCVNVSKWKCYRARWCAMELIRGSVSEHYKLLRAYKGELVRVDKWGRFEFLLEDDGSFKGFFVGFSALIKGFMKGCRPIIGFDGCFLKTTIGGALLTAVAKDGNNQMFPVCYAVVQAENEYFWTWFLELLFAELGVNDGLGWTFMSDQQKGLLNALIKLAPHAEMRNCARHVYMNWKKSFKGQALKNLFWRAVRSTHEAGYNEAVEAIREVNEDAYIDFKNRDPTKWCKAFVSSMCRSDMVDNNVCETFNGWIVKSRSKPMIDMLEDIRAAMMERQHRNLVSKGGMTDKICPRIREKIEANKYCCRNNVTVPAVGGKFQVTIGEDQFVVDLKAFSCSCRSWNLTGIPCPHACSAIEYMKEDVTNYVNDYYGLQRYVDAYSIPLQPINGKKMWLPIVESPILPPPFRVMSRRPKKKRKRAPEEEDRRSGKLSKCGLIMTCSKCGVTGHNKRSCTSTVLKKPLKVPGIRGRPRKNPLPNPTGASSSQPAPPLKRGRPPKNQSTQGRGKEKERRQVRGGYGVRIFEETGNIYMREGKKVQHVHGPKNQAVNPTTVKKTPSTGAGAGAGPGPGPTECGTQGSTTTTT